MEDILVAAWHKLKAALKHIEEALGFVPQETDGTVHTDSGGNGPPPNPPKPPVVGGNG